jgi:RimJ/RimL family protein N-acetyltransferase
MSENLQAPTVFRMGKRVYLRPIKKADLPLITRWINDPDVTQFLTVSYPTTIDDEMKWYETLGKNNHHDVVLAITLRDTNQMIGITGLHRINYIDGVATTGSFIGEKHLWRQGYGSEAKMILLDYAFNTLNLRKICSQVYSTNPRSKGHLEKCGYREEGCLKKHAFRNGTYLDVFQMAVFKENFLPLWEAFKKDMN